MKRFVFSIAVLILMLPITSCTNLKTTKNGINLYEVPLLAISAKPSLGGSTMSRTNVSRITLSTPNKGYQLASMGVSRTTYSGSSRFHDNYRAKYQLKENSEEVFRDALGYAYDLRKTANRTAKVDGRIKVLHKLDWKSKCALYFVTTIVTLDIEIEEVGRPTTNKQYVGKVEDSYCTSNDLFPPTSKLGEGIQQALHKAVTNVVLQRNSIKKPKLNQSPNVDDFQYSDFLDKRSNSPISDYSDKDICFFQRYGIVEHQMEATIRGLTPEKCKELLGTS